MQLFDLPLDIVRILVRQLVLNLGIFEAAKLRQVCSLFAPKIQEDPRTRSVKLIPSLLEFFDNEVLHLIEVEELFDENFRLGLSAPEVKEVPPPQKVVTAFSLFIARFLERRPFAKSNDLAWDANSSVFLNRTLDACGIGDSFRIAALRVLCRHICECGVTSGSSGLVNRVARRLYGPKSERKPESKLTNVDWECHLLPAAIVLKAQGVYDALLPVALDGLDTRKWAGIASEFFGTPLFAAVVTGQQDLARQILASREDLISDMTNPKEWNCIAGAVRTGNLPMLELLLSYNPRPEGWYIQFALIEAAKLNRMEMTSAICLYIERSHIGREQNPPDLSWSTQWGLRWACANRNRDMMQLFLDLGAHIDEHHMGIPDVTFSTRLADVANYRDMIIHTIPSSIAAWLGDKELLIWLVDHGATLEYGTVHSAAIGGSVEVMEYLFEQGIRNAIEDLAWVPAIANCVRALAHDLLRYLLLTKRVVDFRKLLEKRHDIITWPMFHACQGGDVESFDILVEAGMPVDMSLREGPDIWTPMMAAQCRDSDGARAIVRRLEEMGIEKVDMLKTEMGPKFVTGELPSPPRRWKSEMPQRMWLQHTTEGATGIHQNY